MKRRRIAKAIALVLSACITVTSVSWENLAVAMASETKGSGRIEPEDVTMENEMSEERTESSTVYDLGDSCKMEVFYGTDVRFRNEEGELTDYDPSLVAVTSEESIGGMDLEGYAYENKEGDSKQYLPETLSEQTPVVMEKEGYRISFHPVHTETMGVQEAEIQKSEMDNEYLQQVEIPYEGETPDVEDIGFQETEPGVETVENLQIQEGNTLEDISGEEETEIAEDMAVFSELSIENMEMTDLYGQESLAPLKAVYENPEQSYHLEYESSDIGVKENIVLSERPENNRFVFEFHLDALDIRKNPTDEGFTLYDENTGEIVGCIDVPFMNDATGMAYSEEIVCELEEKEGTDDTYLLSVIPNKEYLDSAERIYPVIIDPTVTWTGSSRIQDAYVCKGSPGTNYYSSGVTVISAGYSSKQGLYRTYMKFPGIKEDLSGKYVESAQLELYETGGGAGGENIRAYRITDSWTPASLTWNNKPAHDTGSYYSQFKSSGTAGTKKILNLTEHARQMARNQYPAYGIMLRAEREGTAGYYTQFYGSRYATAAKRPKLTVVYYDGPTKPDTVQTNGSYFKKGTMIQATWSGIVSRALDRVEFKLVGIDDSTANEVIVHANYSANTKIGTTASGTASIANSNTWPEGCYRIWVRGVDKGGIAGPARSWNFHIDSTAPVIGSVSISPTGYTSIKNPVLKWSSVTEKHLKEIQYQVGSAPYVTAGTGTSGSVTIPSTYFPDSGTYTIRVRAVDHAGNISAVKTLNYLVDVTCPAPGTVTSSPTAGQWTANGNPVISFSGITELHSGLDASGIKYCITSAGQAAETYKAGANVAFTASASPYAGSFTMDTTDQNPKDGEYSIHVRLEDRVGNAVIKTLSYKRDNTPPSGNLEFKQTKSELCGTVSITASCEDKNGSGIKNNSLVIRDINGNIADTLYTNYTTSQNVISYNTENLRNGTYTAVLTITDQVGNTSTVTDTIGIRNQMPAPTVTGSNRNDGRGIISWQLKKSVNTLQQMEYQLNNTGIWNSIPGFSDYGEYYAGGFTVGLLNGEGAYTIRVRAVDENGLPGKEASVRCVCDRTAPSVSIQSIQQGIVKGTVTDPYLQSWSLKVRKTGDTAYRLLTSGSYAVSSDVLYIVNIGGADYQAGCTYEFLLEAVDVAGNEGSYVYRYTKQEGDTTAVQSEPVWFLEHPDYLKLDKNTYSLPQNTNYLELKTRGTAAPASVEWYIDNGKISTVNHHDGKPWILDFHKIKAGYPEGTMHTLVARCKDESGRVSYSVPEYKKALYEYLPVTSGTVKTLSFAEPLSGFTLESRTKSGSTGTVSYYVKIGTGAWKKVTAGTEYTICELAGGQLTVNALSVKAEWGAEVQGLEYFRLVGNTLTPEKFRLSEMDNYVPDFLSAVSKINYKTYLTWSRPCELDPSDKTQKNDVELPENITYEIFRSTSEETLKQETVPVAEGIRDDYFSEININYGKSFYYRIRAVKTVKDDTTGENSKTYSSFSRIFCTRVVDGDEYTKFLGVKPYWCYEDFSTPNGTGSIEKSRGNFNYTQTEAVIPNRKLPVEISRSYNSQSSSTSSLGEGWNHSLDLELLNINDGNELMERLAYKDETGSIFLFAKLPDGSYASSMGRYLTLKAENRSETIVVPAANGNPRVEEKIESAYTMLSKDNQEYRFNTGGQLVYTKEPNGSFILLEYDAKTGRLVTAITNRNLVTRFQYADHARKQTDTLVQRVLEGDTGESTWVPKGEGDGIQQPSDIDTAGTLDMEPIRTARVMRGVYKDSTVGDAANNLSLVRKMILPDQSTVSYEYDNHNHLLKVTRKAGGGSEDQVSYRYEYDSTGKLSAIYDALDHPYRLTYESGRVKTAVYPQTDSGQRSIQFTYRDISEGNSVYETMIRQGVDGEYGAGELVKSSRSGNMLYNRDEKGAESTYTYEDNMLKTTTLLSEYQELDQGTVITREGTRTTDTSYDEAVNYNPVSETDEEGNEVTYEYAEQENVYLDDLPTSMIEVEDDIVTGDYTYEYDANGNELKEADSVTGDSVETVYYGTESAFAGEVKKETEKVRVISENGQASYKVTTRDYQYSYDSSSGVLTETVTETVDGKSVTTVDKYDRMGNLIYSSDGLGTVSSYSYDFLGRQISESRTEGSISSNLAYSYDANGTLIRETAKDGTVSEYTYDAENRLTEQKVSKGSMSRSYRTEYAYEWQGNGSSRERMQIVTGVSPGGKRSQSYYNIKGWNTKNIASGICSETEYNRHGEAILQKTGAADGTGEQKVILTLYDNSGNPAVTIQNPVYENGNWKTGADSVTESSTYDKRGNVTSETDGEGHRTDFEYDALSRLVEVSMQDGTAQPNVTRYGYDILESDGTVSMRTTDAMGNISKDYMDGEGRTVRSADLGNGQIAPLATNWQYDKKGNVIRETYGNNDYKTYEYDGRNRLTKVSCFKADGTGTLVTKYTYSSSDQILTMEDFEVIDGTEQRYRYTGYEYDDMKQLTGFIEFDGTDVPTSAQKDAHRVSFAYDADGKFAEVHYSQTGNHVVSLEYQYDGNGWLTEIYAGMDTGARNILRSYFYTPDGKVSESRDYRNFAAGDSQNYIRKVYTYDSLNRVTAMTYSDSTSPDQVEESYSYTYDRNSSILTERIFQSCFSDEGSGLQENRIHTYDALGRLISTEVRDFSGSLLRRTEYTYDRNGNRLTETTGDETTRNTYNSLGQMTTSKKTRGNTVQSDRSCVYDANGNLKSDTDNTVQEHTDYSYDVGNCLVQAVKKKNGTVTLTQTNRYNGSGQRIQKAEQGKTTNYYYQGSAVLSTTDGTGSQTSFNLYGLEGNVIASCRYSGSCADQFLIYNKDLRGSTTSLQKADGSYAAAYRYTDFGETSQYGGTDIENEICYTGGIYDESTGLYYLNARYYAPQDGRFLSQDTYRGEMDDYATWNLYAYCANNPVTYVDPSGHVAEALVLGKGFYAVLASVAPGAAIVAGGTILTVLAVYGTIEIGKKLYTKVTAAKRQKAIAVSNAKNRTKKKTKSQQVSSQQTSKQLPANKDPQKEPDKKRNKNPIGKRKIYNTRKKAYEAAKRAGKGKEPVWHKAEKGRMPHYHPNKEVCEKFLRDHKSENENYGDRTNKSPYKHDHYFYGGRNRELLF